MKKCLYLTLVLTAFVMQGCVKDFIKHVHDHYEGCGHDQDPSADREPSVEISRTQVIVRFDPLLSLSESQKADIRNENGITDFKPCSCGDPNLELWGNESDILDVEGVVGALRGRSGAEGDFQFFFSLPPVPDFQAPDVIETSDIANFLSNNPDPNVINIAILDSGIDYLKYFESGGILYLDPGARDCEPSDPTKFHTSGWNFIDGSGIVLDDNGHGTYVTKLITTELDDRGIDYRVMPLKVFKNDGQGSLWDIICAVGYIRRIQEEDGDIDIVNASFGGTITEEFFEEEGLLNRMISEMGNEMLFITSAGNDSTDTDNGPLKHFPSGYKADNILAVGGYKDVLGDISIHPRSNYGNISIDLAVPFEGWNVEFEGEPSVGLSGTSYSAAYVSALVSEYYINNSMPDPLLLKDNFLGTAEVLPSLNDTINGSRAIRR